MRIPVEPQFWQEEEKRCSFPDRFPTFVPAEEQLRDFFNINFMSIRCLPS